MTSMLSRYLGCLLGGALGDALGYPVEFARGSEVDAVLAKATHGDLLLAANGKALVSDDTQMTLFTADGLVRAEQRMRERGACSSAVVLFNAYQRWLATQVPELSELGVGAPGWLYSVRALHAVRAPGATCLSALGATRDTGPRTVDNPPNDSKGCGALMRSAPIGLTSRSPEAAFELARDAAVTTHGHPSGHLAAAYFAAVVQGVTNGEALHDAMMAASGLLAEARGGEEVSGAVARAVTLAAAPAGDPRRDIESLGGGWVAEEALAIAIYCALTAKESDMPSALRCAVAHDGDSDSTGSLVGNLLGAKWGVDALPKTWLEKLELREEIETLARDLHDVCARGAKMDADRYPPC